MWHNYLSHFSKISRYTLGAKIDNLFTDCLELSLLAKYSPPQQKTDLILKLSAKLDCLKFFLQILWELKIIDNKKYTAISWPLEEIGKMIGGWMRFLKK